MKEKKLDVKSFAEITAYHEASHFILALLMNKFDNSFEKPKKATIKVIIGERYKAEITVNIPGILHKELANDETLRIKQIFGSCFVLLSGYYSYNVFYPGDSNCIMEFDMDDRVKKKVAKYTNLKFIKLDEILENLKYYGEGDDVKKFSTLIHKEFNIPSDPDVIAELHQIIGFLFYQLDNMLNENAIKDAIELVKDKLIENNGKVIEGKDLKDLIVKTEHRIINVDITKYLDACERAYQDDDWSSWLLPTLPL